MYLHTRLCNLFKCVNNILGDVSRYDTTIMKMRLDCIVVNTIYSMLHNNQLLDDVSPAIYLIWCEYHFNEYCMYIPSIHYTTETDHYMDLYIYLLDMWIPSNQVHTCICMSRPCSYIYRCYSTDSINIHRYLKYSIMLPVIKQYIRIVILYMLYILKQVP